MRNADECGDGMGGCVPEPIVANPQCGSQVGWLGLGLTGYSFARCSAADSSPIPGNQRFTHRPITAKATGPKAERPASAVSRVTKACVPIQLWSSSVSWIGETVGHALVLFAMFRSLMWSGADSLNERRLSRSRALASSGGMPQIVANCPTACQESAG